MERYYCTFLAETIGAQNQDALKLKKIGFRISEKYVKPIIIVFVDTEEIR